MDKRKIQFIAGTTYSVSLPKEWIRNLDIKAGSEVMIRKANNNNLLVCPIKEKEGDSKHIQIYADKQHDKIENIILANYFMGFDEIVIISKKELSKSTKKRIRKILPLMSGTEIVLENENEVRVNILLDKSKIDITRLMNRILLIIRTSLEEVSEGNDSEEIRLNEEEIDRLYFLIKRIITVSLKDFNILKSSNIRDISLIPSLIKINQKLEAIADTIIKISEDNAGEKLEKNGRIILKDFKDILKQVRIETTKIDSKKAARLIVEHLNKRSYNVRNNMLREQLYRIRVNIKSIYYELINMDYYNSNLKNLID